MAIWNVEIFVSLDFKQELTSHYKEFTIPLSLPGSTENVDFIKGK